MFWVLLLLIGLVAVSIPILAIVLNSPLLRKFLESRHGDVGGELQELRKRMLALEDEVEAIGHSVESLREEAQFMHRLLENPDKRDAPQALPPSDD